MESLSNLIILFYVENKIAMRLCDMGVWVYVHMEG